jgi:hypothetical protein
MRGNSKEGKPTRRRNDARRSERGKDIRRRMQALLDTIDYDFSQFTLEDFCHWLEDRRGRRIEFVALPLKRMSGGWIATTGDCDLVFYPANLSEVYQNHVQLHEMSHMILGHRGITLDFLREVGVDALESMLLRSAHQDEVELEAEVLASLIQHRAIQHGRLRELLKKITQEGDSVEYLTAYIKTLEKHA